MMNVTMDANPLFDKSVFSTALLPTLEYLSLLLKSKEIRFEKFESFQKQNNRSRFHILSPNGLQTLHIPLKYCLGNTLITQVEIDYKTNWQRLHWRSIEAAYNRSPFFEFYADGFKEVFFNTENSLLEYNLNLLKWILKTLKQTPEFRFTDDYNKVVADENDFRILSNSKNTTVQFQELFNVEKYHQVFGHKLPFEQNLSCIDLIFNTGNAAIKYLK